MITVNGLDLYSIQDVMTKLNIKNRGTINTWVKKGDLAAPTRIANAMYWTLEDIEAASINRLSYLTTLDVMLKANIKSRNTLYTWINKGQFPKPNREKGQNRWNPAEVNAWLEMKESA